MPLSDWSKSLTTSNIRSSTSCLGAECRSLIGQYHKVVICLHLGCFYSAEMQASFVTTTMLLPVELLLEPRSVYSVCMYSSQGARPICTLEEYWCISPGYSTLMRPCIGRNVSCTVGHCITV